jgi:hypothetical protein
LLAPTYLMPYDLLLVGLPILWLVRDGARNGWMRGDGVVIVSAWLSPIAFYAPPNWSATAYAPFFVLALLVLAVRRHLSQRAVGVQTCASMALAGEPGGSC